MKRFHSILIAIFGVISLNAQTQIQITIDHQLGDEDFAFGTVATNNLDNTFTFNRLQYYISGFEIVHDGGQVTSLDDLYVLVTTGDNKESLVIDLGEWDFDMVEQVSFRTGVDEPTNHDDPAQWPEDHALAPKFPSMHWGWAGGYRFVALEGKSGPNVDLEMQFHMIGDEFYEPVTFDVNASGGGLISIDVKADYEKLLEDIEVNQGKILHGNLNDIITLADNLQTKVYTYEVATATEDPVISSSVFPTVSLNGSFSIDRGANADAQADIYSMSGQKISSFKLNNQIESFELTDKGAYNLILSNERKILATHKIIVQ